MAEAEFGTEKFINKNCWLATALGRQIYSRCGYCRLTWRQCYYGPRFLVPSLLIPFIFFLIILIAGIKIERNLQGLLVIAYLSIFGIYSYLFNKSADEIIEASFKITEKESEIGRLKAALEKKLEETNADLFLKNKELEAALNERERTAKELAESEKKYRELLDISPDAIFLHSEGKVVFANNAGLKLIGAAGREEVVGKSAMDFVHPDYREIAGKRIRESLASGKKAPLIEEKFIRLDGGIINVEVLAIPAVYQNKPAMQVIVNDIAKRKRSDAEFKKHADELEKINKFMVGRELDMVQLKKEVNAMLKELGRDEKYRV